MKLVFIPAWTASTCGLLLGGVYALYYGSQVGAAATYHELYGVIAGSYPALRFWAIVSWTAVGACWLVLTAWTISCCWPPPRQRTLWLAGLLTPIINSISTAITVWRSPRSQPRWLIPIWATLSIATTAYLVWSLRASLTPVSPSSAAGMQFVSGETAVPATARQAALNFFDRPTPALRNLWGVALFAAFALSTVSLMWQSANSQKQTTPEDI